MNIGLFTPMKSPIFAIYNSLEQYMEDVLLAKIAFLLKK